MVSKEKRDETINGNKYHITIAESKRRWRVSVYRYSSLGRYNKSDAIVTNRSWRGSWLWFGHDPTNIESLIQETVNEAVCIREDKLEKQHEYENRINDAIGQVKDIHEQ